MTSTQLLLGTYTPSVYQVQFNPPTQSSPPSIQKIRDLPIGWGASWLTQHPTLRDIWYVALEADDQGGIDLSVEGKIAAFRIDESGARLLCETSAVNNPCHVEVVGHGIGLAVANFSGGSALLIPLRQDGSFESSNNQYNYIQYPKTESETPKCHQCVYVPTKNECWIVDTGSSCVRRMKIEGEGVNLHWTEVDREPVLPGHGPRQIIVSSDARDLYTLHARSCQLSHHDLSLPTPNKLVSTHNILHSPHRIDLQNRGDPPYCFAGALNNHIPSRTLIATSRSIPNEKVDSLAFFKIAVDGTLGEPMILRPSRGKVYRGVGIVGDCYWVAGQEDGWLSCFQWDEGTDSWSEREFETAVNLEKVVDIKQMR